jgi:hypothetical protein
MAAMVECKCKFCDRKFEARVADRKRGWGKFCSKSCKAKEQEKRTGQYKGYIRRSTARVVHGDDYDDCHPLSDDAFSNPFG